MFSIGGGLEWQRRGFATGWMNDSVAMCEGWEGVSCDEDGRVKELKMGRWSVTELPQSIGGLSNMVFL